MDKNSELVAYLRSLKELLGIRFITAEEYWTKRQNVQYISTGCKALDDLLGGGIETQAITELVGETSRIKTLISHKLCISAQTTCREEKVDTKVVYIDTDRTFRPEILVKLAKFANTDSRRILRNIIYSEAVSLSSLTLLIEDLFEKDFRLLLISSVDSPILYDLSIGISSFKVVSTIAKLYLKSALLAFEKNAAIVFFFTREPKIGDIFLKRSSKIIFFKGEEDRVVFSDIRGRRAVCQIEDFQ